MDSFEEIYSSGDVIKVQGSLLVILDVELFYFDIRNWVVPIGVVEEWGAWAIKNL